MVSEKQKKILCFPYSKYTALIASGAVRSGKSSFLMISAVDYVMRTFDGQNFIIAGKTVSSAVKNLITPFMALSYVKQKYRVSYTRTDNKMVISCNGRQNTFYVYGGKDESSYQLVQGLTAAGCLLDEVCLMCESFVNQVLARCSVEGSKFFFSCNPDSPEHWFYKEWVLKAKEKNALYLQFQLEDNPSLSEEMINRYKSLYSGSFYEKYIMGKWVVAEGLVYQVFDKELHTATMEDLLPVVKSLSLIEEAGYEIPESLIEAYEIVRKKRANPSRYKLPKYEYFLSMDYGITNPCAALLWTVADGVAICIDEYYYNPKEHNGLKRTDEEHYAAIYEMVKTYDIECIVIDPSANSFKEVINRHDDFIWHNANNSVIQGISFTTMLFDNNKIKISPKCEHLIAELALYSWDNKAKRDAVLKENDHACDAMRYFCYTVYKKDYFDE